MFIDPDGRKAIGHELQAMESEYNSFLRNQGGGAMSQMLSGGGRLNTSYYPGNLGGSPIKYTTFGQTPAYAALMSGKASSLINNGNGSLIYWTGTPKVTGNSTDDRANIEYDLGDAHTIKVSDYLDYANFANDRIGDFGSILEHTRYQGGSIGIWTSTVRGRSFDGISYSSLNWRYYGNNWGGNVTTGATWNVAKYLGKGTFVAQIGLGIVEVGDGVANDYNDYDKKGMTNARNTVVTAAKVASSMVAGMYAGAAIGTAIPIPIVGTIVGAVGGAIFGYIIGEVVARDVGQAFDNFEK